MNAPVALFVYNRPEHTSRSLEALKRNDLASETDLYIFADGIKKNSSQEEFAMVEKVRAVVSAVTGFKNIFIFFSPENLGLERSIIAGINMVFQKEETIIVLEDDIITSKKFLFFCNESLVKYEAELQVAAISGYMFPVKSKTKDAFFLPTISCWGWATWKRAWKLFDNDGGKLLGSIQAANDESRFDLNCSYPYLEMLKLKAAKKINSWAICWYASLFVTRRLMLYPPISLTQNIGMDGSGTNFNDSGKNVEFHKANSVTSYGFNMPDKIVENKLMQKKVEHYLRAIYFPKLTDRILSKLQKHFNRSFFNINH